MRVLRSKKVTNYRFLNMFELEYLDKNDQPRNWQLASRQAEPKCVTNAFQNADAVIIAPYHVTKNCLVLIKEFRVPLGGYQIGFPAGLIDPGENQEQAVRRELMEETGLNLLKINHSSPPVYSSSGLTDESISMVMIDCDGEPTNKFNESSEDIETIFATREEARKICDDPSLMMDVKSWLVASFFAATGQLF